MKIVPCSGPFGVEIHDLDLARIRDDEVAACRKLQQEHGVVFFRRQNLDCEQHVSLAKRFGEIVVNRFFERVPDYPMIAMVRKEATHDSVVGEDWHTDHSYDQEPAMGSILYAREVPDQGGETLFINMARVFESLPEERRAALRKLRAHHSSRHAFSAAATRGDERYHSPNQAVQDSIHPVVIRHPDSGREVLYVNPDFTVSICDWEEEESKALLEELYAEITRPDNVLAFHWEKDSIAFWDNRMTWHRASNNYPGERRVMHRITLAGCPLQ
jgi:taurine dioxygenase